MKSYQTLIFSHIAATQFLNSVKFSLNPKNPFLSLNTNSLPISIFQSCQFAQNQARIILFAPPKNEMMMIKMSSAVARVVGPVGRPHPISICRQRTLVKTAKPRTNTYNKRPPRREKPRKNPGNPATPGTPGPPPGRWDSRAPWASKNSAPLGRMPEICPDFVRHSEFSVKSLGSLSGGAGGVWQGAQLGGFVGCAALPGRPGRWRCVRPPKTLFSHCTAVVAESPLWRKTMFNVSRPAQPTFQ